jgi:hypothetical protein
MEFRVINSLSDVNQKKFVPPSLIRLDRIDPNSIRFDLF